LVIPRVLAVLVKRLAPRNLLRRRVNLDRAAAQTANRGQYLTRHISDRSIGCERDTLDPAAAVLDRSLVGMQIEYNDK
jgi:hypothetical protein